MTTRDLPSTYTDVLQAATTYPLYLIEFDTGAGFARITNNHKKIVFPDGGDTFYPRPLEVPEIAIDLEGGQGGTIPIALGQFDGEGPDFDTLINTVDFRFKLVTIALIDQKTTGDATYAQQDTFFIESWPHERGLVTFDLKPLTTLLDLVEVPKRTVDRNAFPNLLTEE